MPTLVNACGFECGQAGSAGQHFSLAGTSSIVTSTPLSGLRSLRSNPTGGSGVATFDPVANTTVVVVGFRIRFDTLPSADTLICFFSSANGHGGVYFKQSDSKIYAGSLGGIGATGVSVTTGVEYWITARNNVVANPKLTDVSVNGVACGQRSDPDVASTVTTIDFGSAAFFTVTCDIYIDDIVISQTSGDYPIADSYIDGFVPNGDGTHTATTTTIVKGTIAAPTGGGNVAGAIDVNQWVNGRPLLGGATDNTRLVNQQTAGTTLYAEVDFEASAILAPYSVEIITADREATTASGHFAVKLNDNGTEDVIIDRGVVAGVTTDRYARKHYIAMVGGGAWTLARFNALKARFGYSSDATPDQYWRGIMIEAVFLTPAGGQPTRTMHQARLRSAA